MHLTILMSLTAFAQNGCEYPIFLKEFNVYFNQIHDQSVDTIYRGDKVYILNGLSCEGDIDFPIFDKNGLSIKGSYSPSLDLLIKQNRVQNVENGETSFVHLYQYYEPLPHGKWSYFEKDSLIRTIIYNNGVYLDTNP